MLGRSSGVERRSVSARVSQCHGWGSMHSRVHNLATRSMQQRCIPHTFAIGFSRVWSAHRRRKTRCERGRAFLPSHYLLLALSLSLSLSLPFHLSFSFSPQSATRRTIRPLRVYTPVSLLRVQPYLSPLFIPHRGPLSWILRSRTAVSHLRSRGN